jgi:hypothetical protein
MTILSILQSLVTLDEQNRAIFWNEPDGLRSEPWGFCLFDAFRWKDVELHDQCIAIFFAFVGKLMRRG